MRPVPAVAALLILALVCLGLAAYSVLPRQPFDDVKLESAGDLILEAQHMKVSAQSVSRQVGDYALTPRFAGYVARSGASLCPRSANTSCGASGGGQVGVRCFIVYWYALSVCASLTSAIRR
jgi:hypothetical protein